MKKVIILWMAICVFLFLSSCSGPVPVPIVTSTATVTATPDLCSPSNLQNTVKPVNDLTRQFDDYAALASNTPQSQLVQVIPSLQTIRRAAEDQGVPTCLKQLKIYQISYMDTFIQTMLALDSMTSSVNADVLKSGLAQAQQYHNLYTLELARLLGITIVAPPTTTPGVHSTLSAGATSTTPAPSSAITVNNPGPNPINLHVSASLTSQTLGTFSVGASATAIAQSTAGDWIQIQIPGQAGKTAWVYTTLIKFSTGALSALPVATSAP